ncbi:unnamed protein product [Adineta ricciae]|uniref:F-box domain-containing protein n=1 Tax=Adineta ricciae TaxID=249248 RepID=A0A814PFE3_ADIRI|nr:unnamed protein product [Adineta ricciae]CAF1104612.1 unnamed protein product [Adineta ricciae]
MSIAQFEDLPDEILLEICIYLTTVDIINAFGRSNSRLERTITQFRHDINLQQLTLKQFQHFCYHVIPSYADCIVKLTINTWYAPGEIALFNRFIAPYKSLHEFLPSLKQIWLINFSNKDIDIIPKILSIEKVLIDSDAQVSLLHSTKVLLDRYLFCTRNSIKELRLYDSEEGFRLQHDLPVMTCLYLQKLIISVATSDDLILIFRRAPNLIKLHVEISLFSTDLPKQYATTDIMPRHIKDFHLWVKDKRLLIFEDLYNILTNIPTIECLSLEIETDDIQYSQGHRWRELFSYLPRLARLDMGLKIWIGFNKVPIDVTPYLQTFSENGLDICAYADTRVLYIDAIPYEFDSATGVMTSPSASRAKATNMSLFQKRARRVNTLCFDGRHESTSANDWFQVIHRFPTIQVLDIISINVTDQLDSKFLENTRHLRLPNLTILRYIRSTKCQVNIPFFMYLANNEVLAPRLCSLTMMYGDFVYVCKRLPIDFQFTRFHELRLYGNGADGCICLKDIQLILKIFPNLKHFWIHVQSSRTINKNIQFIIQEILSSLTNLISLRLSCKKHSLRFPVLPDDDHTWIQHACRLSQSKHVHCTIDKKEISVWK